MDKKIIEENKKPVTRRKKKVEKKIADVVAQPEEQVVPEVKEEVKIEVYSYMDDVAMSHLHFLKPLADLLVTKDNEQCNIQAVKFSATCTAPLYRIFGMPNGEFKRFEEIFADTLLTQQHTIDIMQLVELEEKHEEITIPNSSCYYKLGSMVSLINSTEDFYLSDLIISHIGAEYTLIGEDGRRITCIPSGMIIASVEQSKGPIMIYEKRAPHIHQVDNVVTTDITKEGVEIVMDEVVPVAAIKKTKTRTSVEK